jgi:23S rRNA (adenine2503-C2)-methyltransferase
MIKKLADDVKVKLAVSLHSAIDEIRSQIMPFSKIFLWLIYGNHWNIGTENKSKISYEYVVWKDNDNKESIDALVKFCKYVPCKVNLIEYNPIDDGEFQQASEDATNAYITLESNGIVVKVRRVVEKILMPCGQCE